MKTPAPTSLRSIDRLDQWARLRAYNDARITKECGLAVGTLGKSRKAGKDLSKRALSTILACYPEINPHWLVAGEGSMEVEREPSAPDYPLYPLYDLSAAECGRPGGLSEAVIMKNLPSIAIPGVPRDTEFFVVASGYSMVNADNPELSIPPGALVGVASPRSDLKVRWGEVYAIATVDGLMIKQLFEIEDPEMVECRSYNPAFPPFRIPKSEIFDIARITCTVPVYIR